MTGPLEFVEAAHKQAEQVARAAGSNPGWWPSVALETRARAQEATPLRAFFGHVLSDDDAQEMTRYFELSEPQAVLRRIAAERKLLAGHRVHECGDRDCALEPRHQVAFCDACRTGVRWPCTTIRALAEGWGWQEEQHG